MAASSDEAWTQSRVFPRKTRDELSGQHSAGTGRHPTVIKLPDICFKHRTKIKLTFSSKTSIKYRHGVSIVEENINKFVYILFDCFKM